MTVNSVLGFINGNIYVSFIPLRKVTGLVVYGERILYSGDSEKAERLAKSLNGSAINLEGLTVMPGFIDTHMHLDMLGVTLNTIDLRGVESIESLKKRLKEYYEKHPDSSWIVGRGWDQELFKEKRWLNRFDLDEVISDKPVLLERICGHAAVINTKALNLISEHFNISQNPNFLKDNHGDFTGVIIEDAVKILREYYQSRFSEMSRMLLSGLKYAASMGVTMVGFMSCDTSSLRILQILRETEGLPIKVRVYLKDAYLNALSNLGLRRGFGDDMLKIMGVKIFVDGSLGAHTAWLSEPYDDLPGTCGIPVIDVEKLRETMYNCHKAGLQLAIHAIGDKAIDYMLDIYSLLGNDFSKHRHRIEHASILRLDQINKIAQLGLLVSIQPHFIISDWWVVKRVGQRRVHWVYPFKSMVKNNIKIGLSTDSPVEPLNPWETVHAAVTRGSRQKIELSKYSPGEALTIQEALHYYTKGAAYFFFEEERIGTLEKGKYADFIIIDKDPLSIDVEELLTIKNLMTIVSGKITYRDGSLGYIRF